MLLQDSQRRSPHLSKNRCRINIPIVAWEYERVFNQYSNATLVVTIRALWLIMLCGYSFSVVIHALWSFMLCGHSCVYLRPFVQLSRVIWAFICCHMFIYLVLFVHLSGVIVHMPVVIFAFTCGHLFIYLVLFLHLSVVIHASIWGLTCSITDTCGFIVV